MTDFRYLRPIWRKNAIEEALLGTSGTGIYDHPVLNGSSGEDKLRTWLRELREVARNTNKEWAKKLGINEAGAITTVKPEGTTSCIADTASGIHPRHSKFYIRTVRQDNKDSLTAFMKDAGVPNEPCVIRPESTTIFFFPVKSPDGAVTREDVGALDHLGLWSIYNSDWSEHQVSVTVNVKEDEWLDVGAWVYKNFDSITGISFLPYDTGTYQQAPFQECTEEEYLQLLERMPVSINWEDLSKYEQEDETTSSQEFACVGGACELR